MQFGRGRGRVTPDDLRRRVVLLHDEILKLEQVLEGSGGGDAGTADTAVRRLRASIVQEELVRKRAELATVKVEASAAGVDVDKAIADDQLNRFSPSGALSGVFVLPPLEKKRHNRRGLYVAAGLAGLIGLLLLTVVVRLGGGPTLTATRPSVTLAALDEPIEAAPMIPSGPVAERGETFFTKEIEITFARGRVYLAGDPPPDGQFTVDDGLRLLVTRPDGTTAIWSRDFNTGCIRNETVPAQDVTSLFLPGVNKVAISLYDICGANRGTSAPIWLVSRE